MSAKTTYLPHISDHALVMAAAMRHHGLPAVSLPLSDQESLDIGKELCLGKECLPCFVCVGDVVKAARRPGFDPERSIFFMPTTSGPCRFGQYSALVRQLLDSLGLHNLEIMSPSAENSYLGFGNRPTALRLLIWRGIVGVDLLQKLRHEYRPYERHSGAVDALYHASLARLVEGIEAGGGRRAIAAMAEAARRFQALPRDGQPRRPTIGIVGEIYLRANPFTNQEIVRQVEALGGEAWVATMMEWFYYTNYGARRRARVARDVPGWIKVSVTDIIQRRIEHAMLAPVAPALRNAHETPIAQVLRYTARYYHPDLGTEAALSLGKAVDFAQAGLAGIINVMPFTCMPGIVVAGLADRLRADHGHIPWLDILYDGQESTNIRTRLEAFMYQAKQYQNKGTLIYADSR